MCSVPMEIWDVIFTLACDQHGTTAAAISRVSRFFYKAIGPYRLVSLMIYGLSQIMAFDRAMQAMPLDVPRAKHLYIALISDKDVKDTQQVCRSFIDGRIRDPEETQDQRNRREAQNSHLSAFGHHTSEYEGAQWAVGRIVSQHGSTLETLTYLTTVSYASFEIFGRLLSLKNLTIVCLRYKSTFYEVPRHIPVYKDMRFPRLERLHLSYFDTAPLFAHDEFRRVAPNLTDLRISGRKCYPQYEKLPLRTKVFVQPILLSSQEQKSQLLHLRRILSVPSYKKRTVLLEPGHREDWRYGFFDALSDWLDVSGGGNAAFWSGDDKVDIDNLAAR